MTPVLIAVIAVAAVALTVVSARQALAERDAVERSHRALDLLGRLADRAGDTGPPVAPMGEYRPQHRKRTGSSRRHPRRGALTVAGAVIAVAVVTSILVTRRHGAAASSQASRRVVTTTVTAASTTTTVSPSVVLVSSDSQQADYRVAKPSVNVQLVPTAPCWVEITDALGHGQVLFAGTLRPGTHRAVPLDPAAGGVSVRLGNPAGVSVVVDGVTMATSWPDGTQPFTLLFQPPS